MVAGHLSDFVQEAGGGAPGKGLKRRPHALLGTPSGEVLQSAPVVCLRAALCLRVLYVGLVVQSEGGGPTQRDFGVFVRASLAFGVKLVGGLVRIGVRIGANRFAAQILSALHYGFYNHVPLIIRLRKAVMFGYLDRLALKRVGAMLVLGRFDPLTEFCDDRPLEGVHCRSGEDA